MKTTTSPATPGLRSSGSALGVNVQSPVCGTFGSHTAPASPSFAVSGFINSMSSASSPPESRFSYERSSYESSHGSVSFRVSAVSPGASPVARSVSGFSVGTAGSSCCACTSSTETVATTEGSTKDASAFSCASAFTSSARAYAAVSSTSSFSGATRGGGVTVPLR